MGDRTLRGTDVLNRLGAGRTGQGVAFPASGRAGRLPGTEGYGELRCLAYIQEQADQLGQGQGPLAGEISGAEAGAVGELGGRQEFSYGPIGTFKFARSVANRLGSAGSSWV